jgi:thiol-disulfide isomerase/thioredoxin
MNDRLKGIPSDVVWIAVSLGIVVLVCAVAVGVLLSVLKSRFDGRFRGTRPVKQKSPAEKAAVETAKAGVDRVTAEEIGGDLGSRATLLQFSSAFCAPCRATRRTLAEVESMVEGVRHVELDAESHLALVRRLDILRTPTVLVLDSTGAIVTRASGQPRKPDVIAALGAAVDRQPR